MLRLLCAAAALILLVVAGFAIIGAFDPTLAPGLSFTRMVFGVGMLLVAVIFAIVALLGDHKEE